MSKQTCCRFAGHGATEKVDCLYSHYERVARRQNAPSTDVSIRQKETTPARQRQNSQNDDYGSWKRRKRIMEKIQISLRVRVHSIVFAIKAACYLHGTIVRYGIYHCGITVVRPPSKQLSLSVWLVAWEMTRKEIKVNVEGAMGESGHQQVQSDRRKTRVSKNTDPKITDPGTQTPNHRSPQITDPGTQIPSHRSHSLFMARVASCRKRTWKK